MVIITGRYKDISGQNFGRLTALYRLHNTKGRTKWLCVCECGNFTEVRSDFLQSGNTKSCGCLNRDIITKHNKSKDRVYNIYQGMKKRCYLKCNHDYKNYGARGIAVCDEWRNNFQAFYNWSMANGYNDKLTIDRIDVNGNYEPNNCRWCNMKQQARNRRNNIYFTYNGETHCLTDWCEILGLNRKTIYERLRHGWSYKRALGLEKI